MEASATTRTQVGWWSPSSRANGPREALSSSWRPQLRSCSVAAAKLKPPLDSNRAFQSFGWSYLSQRAFTHHIPPAEARSPRQKVSLIWSHVYMVLRTDQAIIKQAHTAILSSDKPRRSVLRGVHKPAAAAPRDAEPAPAPASTRTEAGEHAAGIGPGGAPASRLHRRDRAARACDRRRSARVHAPGRALSPERGLQVCERRRADRVRARGAARDAQRREVRVRPAGAVRGERGRVKLGGCLCCGKNETPWSDCLKLRLRWRDEQRERAESSVQGTPRPDASVMRSSPEAAWSF